MLAELPQMSQCEVTLNSRSNATGVPGINAAQIWALINTCHSSSGSSYFRATVQGHLAVESTI